MRSRSGTVRRIEATHALDKLEALHGPRVPLNLRRARVGVAAAFADPRRGRGSFMRGCRRSSTGSGSETGRVGLALFVMAAATLVGCACAAPLGGERVGSRDLVRTGTLSAFCIRRARGRLVVRMVLRVAWRYSGGLGGLLDVGFNVQGIAVQRAYGRPILAGLHGVWSVALFAGGALGAVAAAVRNFACLAIRAGRGRARARERADARVAATPRRMSRRFQPNGFHAPRTRVLALGAIGIRRLCGRAEQLRTGARSTRGDSLGAGAEPQRSRSRHFGVAMAVARFTGDQATSRFGPVRLVGAGAPSRRPATRSWSRCRTWPRCTPGSPLVGLGLGAVVPVAFSASGHAGRARRAS